LSRFEFESEKFRWFYHICSCEESCLLISWCAGDKCDMTSNDENHDRSRRPVTEDRRWSNTGRVLGGRTIERSGDVVCSLHRTQGDDEREFLVLASKLRLTVSSGLASKPVASCFPVWPQNRWLRVSRFWHQNRQLRFGDLCIKIITTVSLFGFQN
jgi:hypothetical protein